MSIRAGYDDRQRDSILVYENMTLGSIFFPDQWDWDQLIPELLALLSWSRRCFAISKRFLPYHRILQALFSIISEKSLPFPIFENNDEYCSNCHILSAVLSIEFLSGEHKLLLQKSVWMPLVYARRLFGADTLLSYPVLLWDKRFHLGPETI